MIRRGEQVFVDTGAWIALAVVRDSFHERAREHWSLLEHSACRLRTSVPVVLETFTYLDRKGNRELALLWQKSLADMSDLQILECTPQDLQKSWSYFQRRDLHKLSLVDASSFVLMLKHKIRVAFTFDTHFAAAGFRCEA